MKLRDKMTEKDASSEKIITGELAYPVASTNTSVGTSCGALIAVTQLLFGAVACQTRNSLIFVRRWHSALRSSSGQKAYATPLLQCREAVCALKPCLGFPRALVLCRTSPADLHRAGTCTNMAMLKVLAFSGSCFPTELGVAGRYRRHRPGLSSITVRGLVTWPIPPEL